MTSYNKQSCVSAVLLFKQLYPVFALDTDLNTVGASVASLQDHYSQWRSSLAVPGGPADNGRTEPR
jgi:hypothetical protein